MILAHIGCSRFLIGQLLCHHALCAICLDFLNVGHVHQTGHDVSLFESLGVDNIFYFYLILAHAFDCNPRLVFESDKVAFDSAEQSKRAIVCLLELCDLSILPLTILI